MINIHLDYYCKTTLNLVILNYFLDCQFFENLIAKIAKNLKLHNGESFGNLGPKGFNVIGMFFTITIVHTSLG